MKGGTKSLSIGIVYLFECQYFLNRS